MRALSYDDLLSLAAPPNAAVESWLYAHTSAGTPLAMQQLLDLGYGTVDQLDEDDADALTDWFERARHRGLARLLEGDDAVAWCAAAVRLAWSWWKPLLEAAPDHDAGAVAAQIEVACAMDASLEALQRTRQATSALPKRGPPPPYVGHFYGAYAALLDARIDHVNTRASHLAECLSYACVAPDGSRRSPEIAALVP